MQLAPKLLPFWYEPEFQTGQPPFVRFKLRPLTQQEMIDVEELYTEARPGAPSRTTRAAQFKAGMLAIVAVENVTDEAGEPIRWPYGIDRHGQAAEALRTMVVQAGLRIIVEMSGGDWARFVKEVEDANKPQQPAEAEPAKT